MSECNKLQRMFGGDVLRFCAIDHPITLCSRSRRRCPRHKIRVRGRGAAQPAAGGRRGTWWTTRKGCEGCATARAQSWQAKIKREDSRARVAAGCGASQSARTQSTPSCLFGTCVAHRRARVSRRLRPLAPHSRSARPSARLCPRRPHRRARHTPPHRPARTRTERRRDRDWAGSRKRPYLWRSAYLWITTVAGCRDSYCLKYVTRGLLRLFSLSFCHDRGRGGLGGLCQGRVPSRTHRRLLLRRPLCRRQETRLGPLLHRLARKRYKVSALSPSPFPRIPLFLRPCVPLPPCAHKTPSRAPHLSRDTASQSFSVLVGALCAFARSLTAPLAAASPASAIGCIVLAQKFLKHDYAVWYRPRGVRSRLQLPAHTLAVPEVGRFGHLMLSDWILRASHPPLAKRPRSIPSRPSDLAESIATRCPSLHAFCVVSWSACSVRGASHAFLCYTLCAPTSRRARSIFALRSLTSTVLSPLVLDLVARRCHLNGCKAGGAVR